MLGDVRNATGAARQYGPHLAFPVPQPAAGAPQHLQQRILRRGVAQLRSLPAFVAARQAIAGRLREVLSGYPDLVGLPAVPDGVEPSHHLFTFFVREPERLSRDRLIHELDDRGVRVPIRYFPLHLTPEWRSRGHRYGECPTAERLWFEEQMNLPCHPGLTDEQVDLLCELLADSLRASLC
ncbi:DegT/DnrJ/EryC1/StrS family aminotransferase [Streptomyces hygroscopicus]|uniref:DegT/DnrJ/EryC1/StrS family aminotransferase n=1 Tax=Streptomyces hygroscopicus TaxID=1912 RepID=UPI003638C773